MNRAISYSETIVAREHLDFGLDSTVPKCWYDSHVYKSRYMDALQLSFPDGERYFITSVRAFRDKIVDPALLVAVRDFIRQEGQHGMAHTRYNELLKLQGQPVDALQAWFKAILDERTRRYSAEYNIALTASAEHFTAMLADALFSKVSTTQGMDPRIRNLLAWHAIEEMEHKSVAFDVMCKVAGVGYWLRIGAMLMSIKHILVISYTLTDRMLAADGYSYWRRRWLHGRNLLWVHGPRKGLFGALMPKLLSYFKPGFHPNDLPVIHNYRDWLTAYESSGDPALACEALLAAAHR
ncbi:metal-dependent hydrolase [Dyella silvatica]|uniref:metal-dependent hydrolase n=1 Tax=Dyella silvatica TaxID=2992128 RepID=UPI002254A50F|nr:metal-dependent hydrolase [Dyella silvatica]